MPPPDGVFGTPEGRFDVRIDAEAFGRMLAACAAARVHETGGILIGRYSDDLRTAFISEATGPTPDSVARSHSFARGVAGLADRLASLWKKRQYYLGEWHFHPASSPVPSPQDAAQMFEIARSRDAKCPEPVLLIVGGNPPDRWTLHVEVFTSEGARHLLAASGSESPAAR